MVKFLFVVQFSYYFLEDLKIWTVILLLKNMAKGSEVGDLMHRDTQIHTHLIQKSRKIPINSGSQKQVDFYIVLFLYFYPFPKRNLQTN